MVLVGKPAVEDIFKALRPILMRNERGILRTMDSYLESKKNSILIESLTIQENKATFSCDDARAESRVLSDRVNQIEDRD